MLRSPAPQDRLLNGLRLLVVDDEEDARQLMQVLLEQYGAQVALADSVAQAMVLFARERPDVLISDIGMPGENGYDLIRKVRALSDAAGGKVPAAAVTAFARVEDRRMALSAGFTAHLAKPVEPTELIAVIASLARNSPPA